MLTLDASPHILVAVRKLLDLTGMDLDRLRHIELNSVASRTQNLSCKR